MTRWPCPVWNGLPLGVNLFDTADIYGHGRSERFVGRLVADAPRDSVVLVSKVGYFAGTAPHGYHPLPMRHQLEQSPDNLRPEHLDAYFMHHPNFGPDDRYFRPLATLKLARTSKPLVGVLRSAALLAWTA